MSTRRARIALLLLVAGFALMIPATAMAQDGSMLTTDGCALASNAWMSSPLEP